MTRRATLLTCRDLTRVQSILSIVPVLISFLPPADCHLYIPVLFKLWEAFNSHVLDERLRFKARKHTSSAARRPELYVLLRSRLPFVSSPPFIARVSCSAYLLTVDLAGV